MSDRLTSPELTTLEPSSFLGKHGAKVAELTFERSHNYMNNAVRPE